MLSKTAHPHWVPSLKLEYDVKLCLSGERSDKEAKDRAATKTELEAESGKTDFLGTASGNSIKVQTMLTHIEMEDNTKSFDATLSTETFLQLLLSLMRLQLNLKSHTLILNS